MQTKYDYMNILTKIFFLGSGKILRQYFGSVMTVVVSVQKSFDYLQSISPCILDIALCRPVFVDE